jgi:hypothetical protein
MGHCRIQSFSRTGKPTKTRKPLVVNQGEQLQLVPIEEIAVDKHTRKKGYAEGVGSGKNQGTGAEENIEVNGISTDEMAEPSRPKGKRAAHSEHTVQLEFEAVKERVPRQAPTRQQRPKVVRLAQSTPVMSEPTSMADESSIIHISSSPSSCSASPPPAKKAKTVQQPAVKGKGRSTLTKAPPAKGKKEKPKLVSPSEYAELILANEVEGKHRGKASASQFLQGYNVFYTGGERQYASETTRSRMQLVRFVTALRTPSSPILFISLSDMGRT